MPRFGRDGAGGVMTGGGVSRGGGLNSGGVEDDGGKLLSIIFRKLTQTASSGKRFRSWQRGLLRPGADLTGGASLN
jgi:hypothetical protein